MSDPKPISIYSPAGKDGAPGHVSLSKAQFPVEAFAGQWYLVNSTMDMWKTHKDVTITYTLTTPLPDLVYNDKKEFRASSAASDKAPTVIDGQSTLLPTEGASTPEQRHAVNFKWRGIGFLLRMATSTWQILGYDMEEGWFVTYFDKTLFTSAGLDIYTRKPGSLSPERIAEIIKAAQALEGEAGKLAQGFFEVKHSE
ncbi:hypothetical protein CALCODRAFT_508058 [Calocera cornea HHB12733]|uniref:Lipocalin/cytosolic fatty-acid binding domain-containing protein n=1 Tax=Calocera cornea HHB12733 TaxID=1353952 RepID=A0A165GX67_9BASI|nr:hypothetical protein CALCODRAFT_508058 [Calocera cornea HHB12733]